MDFDKANEGGGVLENVNTGPSVAEQLRACFDEFANTHYVAIRDAIRISFEPYTSGIHKTFCKDVEACTGKQKRKAKEEL